MLPGCAGQRTAASAVAPGSLRIPALPAAMPGTIREPHCGTLRGNREMRDYGRAKGTDELGDSPGTSLLAVTLGALIIVPALVSTYRGFKRVQAAQRLAGADPLNGWIGLLLYILISPAFFAYVQSGLNPVWEREAGRAPALDGPDVQPS